MKDRFMFRMYDTNVNKMYIPNDFGGVESIYECIKQQINWDLDVDYDIKFNHLENGIFFMQCTGLKDKNGKLIYEGDILDLYVSSKKLYRYEVKYEIGSFMLVSQDEIFDFPNVWNDYVYPLSQLYYEYKNEENCIDECEIIGNVYENPELLENKQ